MANGSAEVEPRGGWGLAVAVAIVGLVVVALAFEPAIAELPVPSFVERYGALRVGAALGFGLTGAALVGARPDNRIGWIMAAIGACQGSSMLLENYGIVSIHEPDSGLAGGGWAIAVAGALWAPAYLAVPTVFLLLFPDGDLPSRRWRPALWAGVAAMGTASVGWFLMPPESNDIDLFPPGFDSSAPTWPHADVLTALAGVIAVPTAVASIASLVVRYRNSSARQRAPLGWVLVGAIVTGALLVLAFAVGEQTGPWVAGLAMLPLPLAVAIGIGQYGLWDTDGLLRKTLAFGALSGGLLLVYVAIVATAGALFERTTGASFVATAVVALLMLPAHRRATRWANEFVYGAPEDPATTIRRLGRQLDSSSRPDELLASVCSTVAEATGASHVAIVLEGECIAEHGDTGRLVSTDGVTVALQYAGESIGELVVGGLPEPAGLATRRLLADLAPHVALAAHAHLLEVELARSHARLLATREEERRRLQHDLHDGVGPMMAALALELDRGRLLFAHDPASGAAVLDQLSDHLREAVRAVRTLVHDLRPPPLDELGLAGALTALGRQLAPASPEIEVIEVGLDRALPAELELAAYRIASEALTNVVRHAGAGSCRVSLVADDSHLVVSVADDGAGFDAGSAAGTGSRSMSERAAEFGGRVEVDSSTRGTTVTATLPLPVRSAL